jgi:pilus assembly protein Flp/PilA
MNQALVKLIKDESGATAVEYGLIAAGIAVAISSSLSLVGCNLAALFTNVANEVKAR